jgi:gluconate kinase
VLIVAGAAGSGKSTVCAALAEDPAVLAFDADVLAEGSAAVADGRQDYPAFWHHLLGVALEIRDNGLIPVFCGVCRPDQVLGDSLVDEFTAIHLLALVSDEATVRSRLAARPGGHRARDRADLHAALNDALRVATVPPPHTLTTLDTTHGSPATTVAEATAWAAMLAR